jgi:antitoxin component YwqK of YwqJK toxin-antitoxin module
MQHGTARFWDQESRLLGEYSMDHGTGIFKRWYDNGVLAHETTTLKGLPTGRQKCWDENGELVTEAYWIRGKRVSRKKYLKACETDSELPK